MRRVTVGVSVWVLFTWVLLGVAGAGATARAASVAETGTIAYVAAGGQQIRLIEPDGSADRPLWDVPNPELNYIVTGLDWRPDAAELAFASDHEVACSIFDSDLYGIQPDGGGLRRLTNAPQCADLDAFPKGTVTVGVNNYTGSGPYFVYVQGAPGLQMVTLAPGQGGMVTFENVADFGDTLQQAVVIEGLSRWIAPLALADVTPGATVHAGTINVTGAGIQMFGAREPAWNRDGTRLGHVFGRCAALAAVSVNPAPGETGQLLLNANDVFGCVLDWGPTPATANQLLYFSYLDGGIYQVAAGSSDGGEQLVVTDGTEFVYDLQWLADGSGFLYSKSGGNLTHANIYEYNFATEMSVPLTDFTNEFARTFSLAPDNQTVVFERTLAQDSLEADLWLMDADGANLRLLVEDGLFPAWSSQTPFAPELSNRVFLPMTVR